MQTAEGALTEVHDMLNRMYSLAEQSANGTYDNGVDRANLQKEVIQLRDEINRIADSSNFNGINLLDGSLGGSTMTQGTAVTNGIQSVTVLGGQLSGSLAITAGLSATGTVSITPSAVTGVTWTAIGGTADLDGTGGGSITFQAVVATNATVDVANQYEGMTITVVVGQANSTGSYSTTGFLATFMGPNGDFDVPYAT